MLRGLPLILLLAAPASADKQPASMAGPFASVESVCKALGPCDCRDSEFMGNAKPFPKPVVVAYNCEASPGSDNAHLDHYIAFQQPTGWFTVKTSEYDSTLWCQEHEVIAKTLPVQLGTQQVMALELDSHGHCDGQSEVATEWFTKHLLVVGLDAAGRPAASTRVLLASKLEESADQAFDAKLKPWRRVVRDVALTYVLTKDGTLQLTTKRSKGIDAAERTRLTAKRRIELR